MSIMNLTDESDKVGYINTGTWSAKAIKEADKLCQPVEIASSKDKNYTYIPKGYDVPTDMKYLHVTSNNTVFGTQYSSMPDCHCPLIADMSSDIFSRKVDVEKYGVIYALSLIHISEPTRPY